MQKEHRCPKCKRDHILHVTRVADASGQTGEGIPEGRAEEVRLWPAVSPWRLALVPTPEEQRRWYKADTAVAGLMEAYVCRLCGYTELYTRDPGAIPVDGIYVREVTPEVPPGPYRYAEAGGARGSTGWPGRARLDGP